MLSTLLATKLHRPRPTASLVARPRLTRRLDEGLRKGSRLILVVAPAGYGKTTLVTDWLDRTAVPSAWISLDEADNDPLRFLTYLAAALQKTLDPKLTRPQPEAFPMTPHSPEAFLLPLINDLASAERPILLALDDYHVITDATVQEATAFLLRHAPANLHLVVLTRADPPFPLPSLRVRERMTEIRDRDLRFTPEEMAAFLNALHHLNLDAGQIAALESRTEGWAAGVRLAALSLQDCSPERAAEFIRAFSGSHHYVVDYLFEEVLNRQPHNVREFLRQTSVLERMCAALCDATLTGGAGGSGDTGEGESALTSQEILEYLERSNLFLVPLDDERRWYRYHHLFVDVLRGMLQAVSRPDDIARLHERASAWYGQNEFVADAYRHALLAGNHARAVGILEENAWSMVLRAEYGALKRWLQALPAELLSRHPWLCINYAWALLLGESEVAEGQLQAAERHLRAAGSTVPSAQMLGHIAAVRAWIAYQNDEPDRASVLSRQALELCPQMEPAISSGLMAIVGVGCIAQGDLDAGARAFAEARDRAQSGGNVLVEVAAHASLGTVSSMRGRLCEAEAIYQEALRRALLHKSPAAAEAYTRLARVHREWNDLASARHLAGKLIESSAAWGVAYSLALGHLMLATILQAQNDVPGANRCMAEADQILYDHPLQPRMVPELGAMRARLWIAQGRLEEARRWAETRGLSADGKFDRNTEIEYVVLARLLLADHQVEEALALLARLQAVIEAAGRYGQLIEILVLQATARELQRELPSALAALERAVSLAQQGGYMRVFLDEGKAMATLLKTATAKWEDPDLLAYARKLLAAFYKGEAERPVSPKAVPGGPLIEPLTEREREVLHLVAAGWTNKEIADKLVISVRTVKKHVENIHGKLGVRSRTEAGARARELNLL